MIPTNDQELSWQLPAMAVYGLPDPEDIVDDEGFGGFLSNWPIVDIDSDIAQLTIDDERRMLTQLDQLATTAEDFDRLAHAAEGYHWNDEPTADTPAVLRIIEGCTFSDCEMLLEGLEIGVAGLTLALVDVGMHTVASCRGHEPGIRVLSPWSRVPAVFFMAERDQAEHLEPLVRDVGAGFGIDTAHSGTFLVLTANSVVVLNNLAQRIADEDWPAR